MSKCPKCGAEAVEKSVTATYVVDLRTLEFHDHHRVDAEFACGTLLLDDGSTKQGDKWCRIRELTAENERLNVQYLAECDRQDKQFWEIERLRAENNVMREALEHIKAYSECRCEECWTGRNMHDPRCPVEQCETAADALKALASPPRTR